MTNWGKGLSFIDLLAHVPTELRKEVVCVSLTRWGGVSAPPFHELNVSADTGDLAENVEKNLERVRNVLGVESIVSVRQVHGNKFFYVKWEKDLCANGQVEAQADGLFTRLRGVALMIKTADCQPVVLFDPVRKVVANIHCGWRGSVKGILPLAVRELEGRFGSNPKDLWAGIGPSMGPCCSEFRGWRELLPRWMDAYQVRPDYFDFWAASARQLTDAGVPGKQIFCAKICTVCNKDYFSYRREGRTGRLGTLVALRT